ncbi:shoot gravitropism 2 (SGR2) [Wolffia australiana]
MSKPDEEQDEIIEDKDELLGLGSPCFDLEETSPDLLKNTPSNIARLEDVIEHSKNRYKYLAQTRSPSDGEDIRWYFCKVPLTGKELAASIPRTEVVGKSDYFRFSVRDSLALEASFLQREEELLSYWWREYAECSSGPKGSLRNSEDVFDTQAEKSFPSDEERVGVPVKGGLYEVDLAKRHCFPVYWSGENRRVLRGHWYARKGSLDWLPLREDISEQLEVSYHRKVWQRRSFQPSGLFAARVDVQGFSEGSHALFTGEDDSWEAWLVASRGNTVKLKRGFSSLDSTKPTQDELRQQKEEEMDDYCSQVPVGHLVFMVHGIGQSMEKANLVDDVGDFRQMAAGLAETHLSPYQRSMQRVLFIPCQWRRGLHLSGESAVEKITLDGVRGLRVTLSATVHDVLYYLSPIYCQDIIDSVSAQLNKLHKKFLKRNPGYRGKVSIYGHSLGSVLSYDILCHQECFQETNSGVVYTGMAKKMECDLNENVDNVEILENFVSTSIHVSKERSFTQDPSSTSVGAVEVPEGSDNDSGEGCDECQQEKPVKDSRAGESDGDELGDNKRMDQIVSSLEEEIRSLREKLAQTELKATSIFSTKMDSKSNNSRHGESRDDKRNNSGPYPPVKDNTWTSYTPYIRYTKLDFKVDTFFAVGSPLGVFLALRNIRIGIGRGQDYWHEENLTEAMPSCEQMLNIFHPYDPVAYRLEPLICKEYVDRRPVLIPYHRGGKRLHIGFQAFAEEVTHRSQALASHLNSVRIKVATVFQTGKKDKREVFSDESKSSKKSYGSIMMEKLTRGGGRVDHVLQEKTFEHPYLSVLGAHTNYWRDHDTALFMLKHLYRDIPEDPDESYRPKSREGSSMHSNKPSMAIFFKNEVMDEDIPLTFSDEAMVKEFTRKARRSMRT